MVKVRIAAFVLSAIAATVVFAGCEDKTTGDEVTLTFHEIDQGSHFGIIGKATENRVPPGSGFSLSIPLQDSSKKTVGRINALCIATEPSSGEAPKGTCSGVVDVPGGQLTVSVGGNLTNVTGAIVGGTGKYEGATGTFTSKDEDKSKDIFNITLP